MHNSTNAIKFTCVFLQSQSSSQEFYHVISVKMGKRNVMSVETGEESVGRGWMTGKERSIEVERKKESLGRKEGSDERVT